MKKLIFSLLLLAAFAAMPALAQNVRYDAPFPSISSTTATPYLVANVPPNSPQLAVCSSPANQVPCTNYATTYDSLGNACANGAQDTPQPQPSACQPTGDAEGNIGFWAPAGTYDYTVTVKDVSYGPYTVTLGSTGLPPLGPGTHVVTTDLTAPITGDCAGWLSDFTLGDTGICLTGSPVATQTITQPFTGGARTSLNANVLNQEVHINKTANALGPNWIQSPAGTIAAGVNVVTLAPCPLGIPSTLTNILINVYIAAVGTPEAATITASTCTSGAASGTITFTAVNSHSAGYTIGSASFGITEAVQYAQSLYTSGVTRGGKVIMPPDASPVINGTAYIQGNQISVDLNNAQIQCNTPSSDCLFTGRPGVVNTYNDVTLKNVNLRAMAASVTGVEISSFKTRTENLQTTVDGTGTFYPAIYQVDNDQASVLDGFDSTISSSNIECTSPVHCTSAVLIIGSGNAGILHASNLNLNRMNCIDNQAQNSMTVSGNFICQNYPMFMLRSTSLFPENANLVMEGGYIEACTNPFGIGCAGFILQGGVSKIGVGNYVGVIPTFANTGATRYMYWVVPIDSSGNKGNPLLAGTATLGASGTYDVKWYRISPGGSYDVLRQAAAGSGAAPTTATFTGGTVAAGGSISTALADAGNCDTTTFICTFTDDIAVATTAYTVPTIVFGPKIDYWPGIAIASPVAATFTPSNNAKVHFDTLPGNDILHSGLISSFGALGTAFIADRCLPGNDWSLVGITCLSYTGNATGATWIRPGANGIGSLQGALTFAAAPGNAYGPLDLITFKSADNQLTFATPNLRPAWQAGDSATGIENAGSGALFQRDNNALRSYIAKVPDNVPQEELTALLKTLRVPRKDFAASAPTGAAGFGNFWFDTADNQYEMKNGANTALRVGNFKVTSNCGTTTTCAGTVLSNPQVVIGSVTLAAGTAVITGMPAFTATTSYKCTATDVTAAAAVQVVHTSTSSITLNGTGSDVVDYTCIGN